MKLQNKRQAAGAPRQDDTSALAGAEPGAAHAQEGVSTRAGRTTEVYKMALSYEKDGVYLSLQSGMMLSARAQQRIVMHLVRKNIQSIDRAAFHGALAKRNAARVLVAPPQPEQVYDETYTAFVEKNHMAAYMTLLPAEEGKGARLSLERVLEELSDVHQLRYGLDTQAVRRMLADGVYGQKTLIAQGLAPVPGEDGRLEFHFDRGAHKAGYVGKDQLLVTKIPPTEGVPGITVYLKPVYAPGGKNYNLPSGRHTYVSEDKLRLYAAMEGRADYTNGCVEVSGCHEVEGNVNAEDGSLDFDGDVVIRGDVRSNCTIRAAGNIEVMGMVEAAVLEAGANIIVHGGVQGSGKAVLRAGGSVSARFVEYATVRAGDNMTAQSLMHSEVSCYGAVEAIKGRGTVVGGSVCAGTYIAAKFIGSADGLPTRAMVGAHAAFREELDALEEEVSSLRGIVSKLQRIVQLPPLPREQEKRKTARIEAMRKLLAQKKLLDDSAAAYERLKRRIEDMSAGQVHVVMTAYPGVDLYIGGAHYEVREPVTYATFLAAEDEIGFTSCMFKQKKAKQERVTRRDKGY